MEIYTALCLLVSAACLVCAVSMHVKKLSQAAKRNAVILRGHQAAEWLRKNHCYIERRSSHRLSDEQYRSIVGIED